MLFENDCFCYVETTLDVKTVCLESSSIAQQFLLHRQLWGLQVIGDEKGAELLWSNGSAYNSEVILRSYWDSTETMS